MEPSSTLTLFHEGGQNSKARATKRSPFNTQSRCREPAAQNSS
jgi:hypothetical protein